MVRQRSSIQSIRRCLALPRTVRHNWTAAAAAMPQHVSVKHSDSGYANRAGDGNMTERNRQVSTTAAAGQVLESTELASPGASSEWAGSHSADISQDFDTDAGGIDGETVADSTEPIVMGDLLERYAKTVLRASFHAAKPFDYLSRTDAVLVPRYHYIRFREQERDEQWQTACAPYAVNHATVRGGLRQQHAEWVAARRRYTGPSSAMLYVKEMQRRAQRVIRLRRARSLSIPLALLDLSMALGEIRADLAELEGHMEDMQGAGVKRQLLLARAQDQVQSMSAEAAEAVSPPVNPLKDSEEAIQADLEVPGELLSEEHARKEEAKEWDGARPGARPDWDLDAQQHVPIVDDWPETVAEWRLRYVAAMEDLQAVPMVYAGASPEDFANAPYNPGLQLALAPNPRARDEAIDRANMYPGRALPAHLQFNAALEGEQEGPQTGFTDWDAWNDDAPGSARRMEEVSGALQDALGDGGLPKAVLPKGLEDGAPAELRDAARVLDQNHMMSGPHKAEVMQHYGDLLGRFRGKHKDDGDGGAGAIELEDHEFADQQVESWLGEQKGDLQESWHGGGVVDRGGMGTAASTDHAFREEARSSAMWEDPDKDRVFPTASDVVRLGASEGRQELDAGLEGTAGSAAGTGGLGPSSYARLLSQLKGKGNRDAIEAAAGAVQEGLVRGDGSRQ